ncbi:MAG: sigma-70 family RNA polymerase sigma factor [Chloroflexi bacterium AL-W]|nr:sigma-70 family RNA polymerase sigma factor [Chloroflexi bacterium AL-N1]NOK68707.1 sigma-70 family RNA polymerase sigma factor [Chloroflexi bacterium AL-N10]NOK76193.1 sigma-70 family RNA polymerase sigma factor [Chloroflexi bacterium AL-N5]NOK84170.1 sigma-70 family RNA polymerase sigma factor [Chloroflexi bacterium AL-W]NOK91331.1 sigma-70 family RNA polymerase sigma factor [Chloroflexi bacterium AL-N15]
MDSWARLTDQQLVTRARSGRPDAYGELVRRYQTDVFNVIYRLTGEQQEALDLAQETFVRSYHALDTFDITRPFGPWIKRIATNLTFNTLQRRRVTTVTLTRTSAATDDTTEWELPDRSTEPETIYLTNERDTLVRNAILELPPHYRAVIELRHFQELSYEEIAEALDITLSDVKSHLFRARRHLRQRLEERP